MESLEQWAFAYQHNVIDVGMIDTVGGLDQCKAVGLIVLNVRLSTVRKDLLLRTLVHLLELWLLVLHQPRL